MKFGRDWTSDHIWRVGFRQDVYEFSRITLKVWQHIVTGREERVHYVNALAVHPAPCEYTSESFSLWLILHFLPVSERRRRTSRRPRRFPRGNATSGHLCFESGKSDMQQKASHSKLRHRFMGRESNKETCCWTISFGTSSARRLKRFYSNITLWSSIFVSGRKSLLYQIING